jgi:hypothetical protein
MTRSRGLVEAAASRLAIFAGKQLELTITETKVGSR